MSIQKKFTTPLGLLSMTGLMMLSAGQLSAATATATASVTISDAPITLTNTTPLSFGEIAPGTAASVVTLANDGTRTVTSGDVTLGADAGSAAIFDLEGEANKSYTITMPAGDVTLTDASGATLTVNNFTHNATGTIPATGVETFNVGAQLNIDANQAAGSYSGSFTVEVVYN